MNLRGSRWGIGKPPIGARIDSSHPLARGLETCLLFNEGGGKRVIDSSGNAALVSTTLDSTNWGQAIGGTGVNLDAVDDVIIVPVQKAPNFEMSISVVIEVTALGGVANTVLSESGLTGFQFRQFFTGGTDYFIFQCGDGAAAFPAAAGSVAVPGLGKHHVVAAVSSAGLTMWLNGVLQGTTAGTSYVPSPAQDVWIGRSPSSPAVYFPGRFHDVRIWSRALRSEEVVDLYVEPYAMFRTPTRAFFSEKVTAYKPTVTMTPVVQIDVSAGTTPEWVDVSADVVSDVDVTWGIHSASPRVRTAEPGTMRFTLDNSSGNAGAVRGYYTPNHPDALAGFDVGTPVRFVMRNDLLGDRVRWVGTIEEVKPGVGARGQTAAVLCSDWMEEASRANLSGLAVQVDAQSDQLFSLIVGSVPKQPPGGIQSGSGSDTYPWSLDNVQDETTRAIQAIDQLILSELGIAHVSAGVAVFEGRRVRGSGGGVRFVLDEDENIIDGGLEVVSGRDAIINRAQVSIHPRRVDDTADVVLFHLGSSLEIQRGTSVTINCPYRDQNQQAQRVGGTDMQTPDAAEGDYEFNTLADGTGLDLTSQLDVLAVFGGNSAEVTVTNNGPLDGFLPASGLQLRGRGLYDFEPLISERRDADSIEQYGENLLSYDMPYQDDPNNGSDLALFVLSMHKDPRVRATRVAFVANWSDYEMEQAFYLAISDRVSVRAPSAGLDSAVYFVNGFRILARRSGLTTVWLDLAPVDGRQYWRVEVTGFTELDETTVLGYGLFAPGWILDASALSTGSFLN